MILDKKLIWLLISILSYGVAKETKRDLWYINPCTGSISNDAPTDDEIQDCVTATPTKTVQPSSAPTQEQNPLNPDNDKKLCPGSEDCSIDVESDTVVPVMFKYSVETQPGADINALLPELEENLLFKLAPSTLDHCLTDEAARTRHLEGSTAPTGICSRPADFQLTAESCDPEKSESNDCFVIMGGLSVAVESGADDAAKDAVKDQILDATKSLMENDELLGSNVAPVEKVKFLGEYPPTDKVLCPGSEDCSIDVESDTVVPVMFKYSVETQPGADINALLPELEENLLFKLAPSTLDHCLTDEAARTRHLEGSTAPTGICSRPADFQLTAESCDPEKSESNDCFVIMGGLSVAVESGADDAAKDAVKDQILDATKSLMENDELLGSNVAPVEKVKFLGEYPPTDKVLCPGSEDCSIDVESDTVVPVMFKYSVETQPGADINALLPELEENLLFKLAPSTLDHCLTDEAARTRHLEGSTAPTGICSRPADFQLTAESCDPEKSESNDCFVIMGGLSVAVESGADDAAKDAVKDQILDATKSLMENDELLGSNVAPVEKVKFLGEYPPTDKVLCPGSEDCSIDVESDTVVPVMFKYSVETQPGADINALLPELEENLLFKLAPSTLDHCLTDEAARTRHLEGSTAPTGICSRPADFQLTAESCDPEKSESNDCFVIMGGLSVAVESGADDAAKDAVKDQILDATKSLMENDELLGSNVAPVEKVKFLGEYPPTDKVLCPGSEDCSIDVESDTVVPVMFKYSVETQPGADINALLPELEENLLFKLAPSTLDHCLTDEAARTRHLEGSTAPTGICSRPADFQLTAESCDPEKSESNDCFVIMGGLSVAVESGADDAAKDAVKDQILDATKSLMENDELLGSNVAPVEKVKFLGEYPPTDKVLCPGSEDCSIDVESDTVVPVMFKYSVETQPGADINALLPELEENLLFKLAPSTLDHCLTDEAARTRHLEGSTAPTGICSRPADFQLTAESCDPEKSESNDCFVIMGGLSVAVESGADDAAKDAVKDQILDATKSLMENDELLGSNVAPVEKVKFLGEYPPTDKVLCPGSEDCSIDVESDTVVPVMFKYSVETQPGADINALLPELEENLLFKLAPSTLDHCLTDEAARTRHLEGSTAPTGICSRPADFQLTAESCDPEKSESNDCFVIMGGLSVAVESSADDAAKDAVKDQILDATKSLMENDELLGSNVAPVEKVKFLGEYPPTDKVLCPGSEDCSIDVESDTVVPVMFKYSVETQPGADINALLPELEENLLFKLAPSTLDHCLTDEAARTRHLEGSTAPTGICSRPADFQLTAESCDPEKSESNDCFVIMGGLSVAVESGADDAAKDAVKDQILDATKSLMENDELLGSNVAPVEKVKFLGEYPPTDKVLCPGSEDCSIDVESDTVVPVMFKYSVETQPGADINALLPELEENLLFKLAPSTLDHCLTDEAARTRHLEGSTAPTGICSRPADFQLTAESCDPEKSESNDCFVIMGGLSVAVESGADDAAKDAVKDQILDATKSLMENDELLGSNVAPVEKVKFLEEVDGTKIIVIVDPGISAAIDDTGDEEKLYDAMIIGGACAALLFLVLAFVMFRRKKNYVDVDDAAGLDIMPGVNGSFVGAASYDLGRAATNMDVHHCTSQMCTKCYRSPPTTFLNTVVNENGRFAKENANVSISQSESNTSDFPDINQSESMDSVKTIDFLEDNMKFSCNPFGFQ